MRKSILHLLSLIIVVVFSLFPPILTSETQSSNNIMTASAFPETGYPYVFDIKDEDRIWIDSLLDKMTVRERIAQMIMPWAGGSYTSEDSKEFKRLKYLVEELKVGGLIFFKGDILNEALLINKMQKHAEVPLLISSDFERGLAMRLTDATEFPYNMALAAAGDLRLAREMGRVVSLESRAMGVHQNYAPVADISDNADNPIINIRAYSEDKDVVSQYVEAFIQGSVEGRMISTVKHFPGHGNTAVDSHKELPVINGTRDELMNNELAPFVHAIRSGVHSVMIGHLRVPSLEPVKVPATLSKNIVTGLLKEEMGFRGLIVTDAMNMNAVTRYFSTAQAAVLAVKAGNDIILMPPDEEIAINAIADAVYSGEISIERINESVKKILSAKKWIGLNVGRTTDINILPSSIGSTNNTYVAHEIAEKSITLVKNDDDLIPVKADKIYTTGIISVSDGAYAGDLFNELAAEEFGYTRTVSLNKRSTDKDYKKALDIAKNSDLILIPSFIKVKAYQGTLKMSDKQTKFINSILNMNKPAVIVSIGNPYLLSLFPNAKTYITSYGDAAVSQRAILRAILGKADISGRLPISIPGTSYKRGDGITISHNRLINDAAPFSFSEAESIILNRLNDNIFSGANLLVSSGNKIIFNGTYGTSDFNKNSAAVKNDFLFDIDQVTSLYTTLAALILATEGKLDLNSGISRYIPGFKDKNIPVRELLYKNGNNESKDNILIAAASESEKNNFIILQNIVEIISGISLDNILNEKLFSPLSLTQTMFNPSREFWYYTLPTSPIELAHKRNKGVVFDEKAYNKEGVAGHAGIFTNGEELAVVLQLIVQRGKYADKQLIDESIFSTWYESESSDLFITGRTGTAAWVNPSKQLAVVFLSNSSYAGKIDEFNSMLPELYTSITKPLSYLK